MGVPLIFKKGRYFGGLSPWPAMILRVSHVNTQMTRRNRIYSFHLLGVRRLTIVCP